MSEGHRVQFRIQRRRHAKLVELAERDGVTPHQMAKAIFEDAIDGDDVDVARIAEDLMVIRAGVELLFDRADRGDELVDAIEDVRRARAAETRVLLQGGTS